MSQLLSNENKMKVNERINTIKNSDWDIEKLGKYDTLVPVRLQLFILYQEMEKWFDKENINNKLICLNEFETQYIRKEKIEDILFDE